MPSEWKEKKERDSEVKVPKNLPVLPLRDMGVYPFIISPLSIAREVQVLQEHRVDPFEAELDGQRVDRHRHAERASRSR